MHSVGELWARLDQGERICDPDNDSSDNSAITLTLDLEFWFKVTTHPSPNDSLYLKYKPDWAKGKTKCPGQVISDGQTDRRTAGQTDWSLKGVCRGDPNKIVVDQVYFLMKKIKYFVNWNLVSDIDIPWWIYRMNDALIKGFVPIKERSCQNSEARFQYLCLTPNIWLKLTCWSWW